MRKIFEKKKIFIISISGKKDQQKTINTIRLFLEFFREETKKMLERMVCKIKRENRLFYPHYSTCLNIF